MAGYISKQDQKLIPDNYIGAGRFWGIYTWKRPKPIDSGTITCHDERAIKRAALPIYREAAKSRSVKSCVLQAARKCPVPKSGEVKPATIEALTAKINSLQGGAVRLPWDNKGCGYTLKGAGPVLRVMSQRRVINPVQDLSDIPGTVPERCHNP
jgi:hypothetical protein